MRILLPLLLAGLLGACAQPAAVTTTTSTTTASGVVFTSLQPGQGTPPGPRDTVRVHYRGTLPDGKEFDSSHRRGQPAQFGLDKVIRCWTEGVQMMRPGGKARLVCPPATAYGANGIPGVIPPNATLTFEVELLAVVR